MSIRNLDSLFDPKSVAVIGATTRPLSMGATVWRNLLDGAYPRPLFAVNPKHRKLGEHPCYASVADLPQAPELAIICTPAHTVVKLVRQLAKKGTRAALVLSAGLTTAQRQAMLEAARPALLRVLGPGSVGVLVPHIKLNASFAQVPARAGNLAFVSQSGALTGAMLDWADANGVGFSHVVSLGERADVDLGDMLDWLATDYRTRAILLYVESLQEARKFMSAARSAARNKPVIVLKAGRSTRGSQVAATHTGVLAGADKVIDAAIARAGMLRVYRLDELFLAAEILTRQKFVAGQSMTVLTNGGGTGVMVADAASEHGVKLTHLGADDNADLWADLDAALPGGWSRANPVDIRVEAPADCYVNALQALARHPQQAGTILLVHTPNAMVSSAEIARAVVEVARPKGRRQLPLITAWMGGRAVTEARQLCSQADIATYEMPEQAVSAVAMLQRFARNQAELTEAPPAAQLMCGNAPDVQAVRQLIGQVLDSGREVLTHPETMQVCQAYGIRVVTTRVSAAQPEAAVAEAEHIGYPVALKILSADINHKSDVGGVALNLRDAEDVRQAARNMLERIGRSQPKARLEGFTVQAMVRPQYAQELIVGASIDPVFGPVILFGQGGTAVEVTRDSAMALPPLNPPLARALIERTRVARLLKGYRDVPPAHMDAVIGTLMAVSQLLADVPEVAELDLNPLLVNHEGAIVLDARMRVSSQRPAGAARFAIAPYPAHLTEVRPWQDQEVTLRPLRPEDEELHSEFLKSLDLEDVRLRLFYSRRSLERSELARLVQVDYTREMAFIATERDEHGNERTLGVARAVADPDNHSAEFGIIMRPKLKGGGLGNMLMRKLIAYQRSVGTRYMEAVVLQENRRMRELGRKLGFEDRPDPEAPDTRRLQLDLQAQPEGQA